MEQLLAGAEKTLVVAAHVEEPAPVELPDAIGHVLEKGAVVGNEDHGAGEAVEQIFQPANGAHVQMVGGLVQQQDLRLGHQHPGQPDPPPPAAGEGTHRPLAVQFKALQNFFDALGTVPAVAGVQPFFQGVQPFAVGAGILAQGLIVGQGGEILGQGRRHHLAHRPFIGGRRVLGQIGDAHAVGQFHFAVVGLLGAAQHVEQGGFTLAVAAEQGDAVAAVDAETDVVQQRPPAEGQAQMLGGEE